MIRYARPLATLASTTLLATAAAAQIDVAIVAAASTSSSDCRFTDTQAKILGTGQVASVAIINANLATPTLADLQNYDAVLTWSNFDYFDSTGLGDVLADYVDAGGGVVVAVFANSETSAARSIQGRWQMGYEVIEDQSGQTTGQATLGTVHQPAHPLMVGVTSFDGGTSSFRPTATVLVAGATSIAEWSDGRILVATGVQGNRVDLGFYPPSADCSGSFWVPSTDGGMLLANALAFTAGGGGVPIGASYCSPATPNSTGFPAVITATGSTTVAFDNVRLVADQLPPGQFGYFLVGQSQGVFFPPGSQGTLCLIGNIGRYNNVTEIIQGPSGSLQIDLSAVPVNPPSPVLPGETWSFQCWFRDNNPMLTSNFTDGVEILFQ